MESRPIRRISRRRRRANSSRRHCARRPSAAAPRSAPPVRAPRRAPRTAAARRRARTPPARRRRSRWTRPRPRRVHVDVRDLDEVAHDFADLAGQLARILDAARAEAIEESLTPLRQRRVRSDRAGASSSGSSSSNSMSGWIERAGGRVVQLAQRAGGRGRRASLRQDLLQPVLEAIAEGRAQTAGQRAVRLGRVGERVLVREDAAGCGCSRAASCHAAHYN